MKRIAISAKISSRAALDTAARTAAELRGRGFETCFDYATADKLNDRGPCVSKNELGKKAALIVKKVLESAIANAEHNDGADIDELKVKTIYVEQGTTLKRFTARAKGRGNRISKPTCHVYVTVGN